MHTLSTTQTIPTLPTPETTYPTYLTHNLPYLLLKLSTLPASQTSYLTYLRTDKGKEECTLHVIHIRFQVEMHRDSKMRKSCLLIIKSIYFLKYLFKYLLLNKCELVWWRLSERVWQCLVRVGVSCDTRDSVWVLGWCLMWLMSQCLSVRSHEI